MTRTTLDLAEDALIAARNIAQRERISLGAAASELIRRGVAVGSNVSSRTKQAALRGRFALLPCRDEIITPQHVRDLLKREDT